MDLLDSIMHLKQRTQWNKKVLQSETKRSCWEVSTPIVCHWNFFSVLLGAAGIYCEVYKTKSFVPTKSSVLSQACSCVRGFWKYDQIRESCFREQLQSCIWKGCCSWFNLDKSQAALWVIAIISIFFWKCGLIPFLFLNECKPQLQNITFSFFPVFLYFSDKVLSVAFQANTASIQWFSNGCIHSL